MVKNRFCVALTFVALFITVCCLQGTVAAQQDPCTSGLGAASRIKPNEQVNINFFKADSQGKLVGDALAPEQIEAGFNEGDAVAIRVSAPFCFYIYVVNVSEWDGTSLQFPSESAENIGIPAGNTKELAFRLENISKKSATTGREELLVLVTKSKIANPDIQNVMSNSGKITVKESDAKEGQGLLKSSLTKASPPSSSTTPKPTAPKTPTFVKVVSVGCKVASIFFPFARIACAAGGFGAAQYIKATGNAIAVAPTADTNQLVFRFSFPVQPKS